MLDNIVIAYSLTPVNKKINVTQTEDFTTRGFNYLLKPNGKLEKFTKGHSKYYYENIPMLHRLPGKTLAILISGGIVDIDRVEDMKVYAQGGALGEIGTDLRTFAESTSGDWGDSLQSSMTADNYYSGSFSYEMSFLDKHHTLIVNCDKNDELENGIGDLGL